MVKSNFVLVVLCGGVSSLLCGAQAPVQAGKLSGINELVIASLLDPENELHKAAEIYKTLSDSEKQQIQAEIEKRHQEHMKVSEKAWENRKSQQQVAEQSYNAHKAIYDAIPAWLIEIGKKPEMKMLMNRYADDVARLAGAALKNDALRECVRELLKNGVDAIEIYKQLSQEKDHTKQVALMEQMSQLQKKGKYSLDAFGRALHEWSNNVEITVVYEGLLKDFVQELAKQFSSQLGSATKK